MSAPHNPQQLLMRVFSATFGAGNKVEVLAGPEDFTGSRFSAYNLAYDLHNGIYPDGAVFTSANGRRLRWDGRKLVKDRREQC